MLSKSKRTHQCVVTTQLCVATTALLAFSYTSEAQPMFKDYFKLPRAQQELYMSNVYAGMFAYSMELQSRGIQPLFCPPQKLALTSPQLLDIFGRWLVADHAREIAAEDQPLSMMPMLILYAMIDAMPCSGK